MLKYGCIPKRDRLLSLLDICLALKLLGCPCANRLVIDGERWHSGMLNQSREKRLPLKFPDSEAGGRWFLHVTTSPSMMKLEVGISLGSTIG